MRDQSSWLLDLALSVAPSEFRRSYREDFYNDVVAQRVSLRTVADVLLAGIAMRVESSLRNTVFAVRTLWKAPSYTFVAILAVALAIGLNVAVASVLQAVLLRPLPYADPQRLAFISSTGTSPTEFSYPKLQEIDSESTLFENVAGSTGESSILQTSGARQTLFGLDVTGNYFATLGVKPLLGRTLTSADLGTRVAVVSDQVWSAYYGKSPAALGQGLTLGDTTFRIVGVLPSTFRVPSMQGLQPFDYYVPIDPHAPAYTTRSTASIDAIVRLRANASLDQARGDLQRVLDRIHRVHPQEDAQHPEAGVTPIADSIVGPVRELLLLLYVAASGVFLIGCANVAGIGLVRAVTREPELALRSALGATRRSIAAQLLTESLVLAIAGGVVGTLLAWAALRIFSALLAQTLPRAESVSLDGRVLAYAAALVIVTAIAIGIMPSLWKQSVRRSSKRRLHAIFVTVQIALATAVFVTAGLLLRSFIGLTHADLGFDPRNVESVPINLHAAEFNNFETQLSALNAVVRQLQEIPGISNVAVAAHLPFSNDSSMPVSLRSGEKATLVTLSVVGPGYLQALRIPLLRGRDVEPQDGPDSKAAALVNATFVRRFFGAGDVVGRYIYAGTTPLRVVGVTGDTRTDLAHQPPPRVYLAAAQVPGFRAYELAVRTQAGQHIGAARIHSAVAAASASIPQSSVRSLEDIVAFNGAHARAAVMLFALLAFVALMLALSGLYAVTSYGVERRTREFGIRRAIGARSPNVLSSVLCEALLNAVSGIAIGIVLIAAFASWLGTILYQTSALDPTTFTAAVLLLIVCTILAALAPAIRAVRIQPARALRYE